MKETSLHTDEIPRATPRPNRVELVLVAAILFASVLLRCAWPSRMAVEHFDEGVYASNIWFGEPHEFRYPDRHLYAPPLLPWLVEWSIVLLGPSHLGSMLVNLLMGSATVVLIWWVARCWFGVEAGLTAAVLAGLSDIHILYSRTALTDVMLCFWLLLAVFLIGETFRTGRWSLAVAAGLATGLAWSTKYNGWLPLAIGLAGLTAWVCLNVAARSSAKRHFASWLLIAVVAAVVWSPVWYGLQDWGGYSAVLKNHQRFFVGLAGWPDAFLRHVASHRHLDGWLSTASVGLALLLPLFSVMLAPDRFTWNGAAHQDSSNQTPTGRMASPVSRYWLMTAGIATLLAGGAAWFGSSIVLGVLAVAGLSLQLGTSLKTTPRARTDFDEGRELNCWLLAAWFCGLLVATPLYQAYPRLTLPWLVSAWLAAAAAVGWWSRVSWENLDSNSASTGSRPQTSAVIPVVCLLVGVSLLAYSAGRLSSHGIPAWQSRTGLETIAANVLRDAERELRLNPDVAHPDSVPGVADASLAVYGEPGLVFHLFAASKGPPNFRFLVFPTGHLPGSNIGAPQFVIIGSRADPKRDAAFAQQWKQVRDRYELIAAYPYHPSDLVLLNEYHPRQLSDSGDPPEPAEIRLYRVK